MRGTGNATRPLLTESRRLVEGGRMFRRRISREQRAERGTSKHRRNRTVITGHIKAAWRPDMAELVAEMRQAEW
jgi:hypothetical protein